MQQFPMQQFTDTSYYVIMTSFIWFITSHFEQSETLFNYAYPTTDSNLLNILVQTILHQSARVISPRDLIMWLDSRDFSL